MAYAPKASGSAGVERPVRCSLDRPVIRGVTIGGHGVIVHDRAASKSASIFASNRGKTIGLAS
jgi:hypothetical protein